MSGCETISAYLDGQLEADATERFEDHLRGCAGCRRAVEEWRAIAARVADVSNADCAAADPTAHEQLLLVKRAELERDRRGSGVVRLALAAAVLLALGVAGGYWLAGRSPAPVGRDRSAVDDDGASYHTDSHSRTSVQLGDDTIHLGPASRVRVLASGADTRLALEQGSLACEVAERKEGGGFSVEASGFSVRVTGTRFLVDVGSSRGPARVVVSAGAVEVRAAGGVHSLEPGELLELDAGAAVREASGIELAAIDRLFDDGPPPAPQTVAAAGSAPVPEAALGPLAKPAGGVVAPARELDDAETSEIDRWRGWVIEGRLDEARSALRGHLKTHPRDAEAWSLLADCERKRASWDDAVAAYDALLSLSTGEQANRARYKAALLLQDRLGDHRRAADLLERFVEQGTPGGGLLVDKARVRLARSLAALGRPDRARAQLERVVASAADVETVAAARQMLEQLERE